jgi:4-hydroxy 2-oxovalerate aldolase
MALLQAARESLKKTKLAVHSIPGFATIKRDLIPAIDFGVDIFRVATHVTEADVSQKHIEYLSNKNVIVHGVLMMSHMIDINGLIAQAKLMKNYGASAIILMDSAGYFIPKDVSERVSAIKNELDIEVGFHAHNNLGMAIANSVAALEAGATMLDGCARGFGAGAGNAQLEVLVAVLERLGYQTGIDLYKILDAADLAEKELMKTIPVIKSTSIISGLSGVFSAFMKPVERIAKEFQLDPRDIFFELGRRKVIAGQEDLILEVASDLQKKLRRVT